MSEIEDALKKAWRDGYDTALTNLTEIAGELGCGSPARTALLLAASILKVIDPVVEVKTHDRCI